MNTEESTLFLSDFLEETTEQDIREFLEDYKLESIFLIK